MSHKKTWYDLDIPQRGLCHEDDYFTNVTGGKFFRQNGLFLIEVDAIFSAISDDFYNIVVVKTTRMMYRNFAFYVYKVKKNYWIHWKSTVISPHLYYVRSSFCNNSAFHTFIGQALPHFNKTWHVDDGM